MLLNDKSEHGKHNAENCWSHYVIYKNDKEVFVLGPTAVNAAVL